MNVRKLVGATVPERYGVLVASIFIVPQENIKIEDSLLRAVEEALDTIPERSKAILCERFGLTDGPYTYRQLGGRFNLTGGRCQQIVNKSLRLLRHPKRSKLLRRFCRD